MRFTEYTIAFGSKDAHSYRLVRFCLIEKRNSVKCTATLIYSDDFHEKPGFLFWWGLSVKGDGKLSVPSDTINPLKGIGIGTFVRDRVVEVAKYKFGGYEIMPAKITVHDAGEDNFVRREKFYTSGGFTVAYCENSHGAGKIFAKSTCELTVRFDIGHHQQIDLSKLLDSLYSDKDQLVRKSDNFDKYFKETQKELDQLRVMVSRYKLLAIAFGIFILGSLVLSLIVN